MTARSWGNPLNTQQGNLQDDQIDQIRTRKLWILLALLPFFGQSFHYVKGVLPLWAMSKAFPILSLPLAFFILRGPRAPGTRQMLLSMLYLVLMPSFTAIFSFQQDFFTSLTSQVKLLPILYFFSFLGFLRWLKPSVHELSRAFLSLGVVTFVILILLWIFIPQSYYAGHYSVGDGPIFSVDDRGNRIRMPMYFGTIAIFYWYRRFFEGGKKALPFLALALGGFLCVAFAVRARSSVLGLALLAIIVGFRKVRPVIKLGLIAIVPLLIIALFQVPYLGSIFNQDKVRSVSTAKALAFLGTSFWRWAIGVGSITPLDPGGMGRYFNHFFFLADITWLGTVFEFGVIGALIILAIPLRAIWMTVGCEQGSYGAFLGALQDSVLFNLAISPLYSMTLSPGEYVIVMAIMVYLRERDTAVCGLREAYA